MTPLATSEVFCLIDSAMDCMQEAMDLSQEQIEDVLHLRRLYLSRRALLAAERDSLLCKVHAAKPKQQYAADNLQQAMDVSARLRAIAVEDYTAYLKVACSVRRGVSPHILPARLRLIGRLSLQLGYASLLCALPCCVHAAFLQSGLLAVACAARFEMALYHAFFFRFAAASHGMLVPQLHLCTSGVHQQCMS